MTAFNFNAREVEPDQGRTGAIPKGWYPSMVEKTEIKPTNGGGGAYIAVQFGIIDGPYKGTKFFTNFNIQNANEQAVEIGRKQLSALCYAVNVLEMTDTDQLKGRPFFTRLKYIEPEYNTAGDPNSGIKYEDKNEPTAYRSATDEAALAAYKNQGSAKPAAAAAAAVPPRPAAAPAQPAAAWVAPAQAAPAQAAPAAWGQPPAAQAAPVAQAAPAQQAAPAAWGQPPATAAAPVQQQAPVQQAAPVQQQAAPVEGQPAWAAAQPWGDPNAGAPVQQAAAAAVVPAQTHEQQVAAAQAAAAPPPWAQPAA